MISDHVLFLDTTLRDGEQSPGCSMNVNEKLKMAHALEELGVNVIEADLRLPLMATSVQSRQSARRFAARRSRLLPALAGKISNSQPVLSMELDAPASTSFLPVLTSILNSN